MQAWYDVHFWTAHPFSSFSFSSSEAGFMPKASYILLCLYRPYSPSCLYKLKKLYWWQIHSPMSSLCTFAISSFYQLLAKPNLHCGFVTLGVTRLVSGQTHCTCESTRCLQSSDKSSLTPVSGDRLLLPVYNTALIWASQANLHHWEKSQGKSTWNLQGIACEPTEWERQKTIFTKQTQTAPNMNYKQQFNRYNPTREMFPRSSLYACCNSVKLPNCRVQMCSFWKLKIHTSMYTK